MIGISLRYAVQDIADSKNQSPKDLPPQSATCQSNSLDRASLEHVERRLQNLLSIALYNLIRSSILLDRSILECVWREWSPEMNDWIPQPANPASAC